MSAPNPLPELARIVDPGFTFYYPVDAVIDAYDYGLKYLAIRDARDHGEFHLLYATLRERDGHKWVTTAHTEAPGFVYQPIHSSMTEDDMQGATYAWDDGTHWHFAHCSPGEHLDFAEQVRTFTAAQFVSAIATAQTKAIESTNPVVESAAVVRAKALVSFAEEAGAVAHKAVVDETLGHWHRNPHHDHFRDLAHAANEKVKAAWAERGKTDKAVKDDLAAINADIAQVQTVLAASYTVEWRPARVARLAAEKAAAEKAAAESAAESTPEE